MQDLHSDSVPNEDLGLLAYLTCCHCLSVRCNCHCGHVVRMLVEVALCLGLRVIDNPKASSVIGDAAISEIPQVVLRLVASVSIYPVDAG